MSATAADVVAVLVAAALTLRVAGVLRAHARGRRRAVAVALAASCVALGCAAVIAAARWLWSSALAGAPRPLPAAVDNFAVKVAEDPLAVAVFVLVLFITTGYLATFARARSVGAQ